MFKFKNNKNKKILISYNLYLINIQKVRIVKIFLFLHIATLSTIFRYILKYHFVVECGSIWCKNFIYLITIFRHIFPHSTTKWYFKMWRNFFKNHIMPYLVPLNAKWRHIEPHWATWRQVAILLTNGLFPPNYTI